MGHPSLVRDPETVMRVFRLQVVVSPRRVRDMRGEGRRKGCVICVVCVVRPNPGKRLSGIICPRSPAGGRVLSIMRARGRQMICNSTKLLVDTPIYMRIGVSFAAISKLN